MRKAGLVLYSVLLWIFFVITSVVLFSIACLVWLLTRWFDKRLVLLHLWSAFWGSWYIWFNPLWRVRIRGRKKIPWRRPCILVCNHQSMLDILVLYQLFRPYKWISKKENFSMPIIGWVMRLNGYLELERRDPESHNRWYEQSAGCLKAGNSLLIFPEGTRYPGGQLGRFMEGAFRMAIDNQADIIPMVLDGTARALPKKGAILTGFADIRVRVLNPVHFEDFKHESVASLLSKVREIMQEAYLELHEGGKKGPGPEKPE